MSNKTTLQNYNTRLNNNNIDLSTILQRAQNLPDAGSGSTPEDLSQELNDQTSAISSQESKLALLAEALAGKAAGGGESINIDELVDALITHKSVGTLLGPNYVNNRITTVGYGAFYEDTTLTGFSGANVTTVADYAFRGCSKVTSLSLPKATKAGTSAFYQVNVPNLVLPEVTTMGTYTFGGGTASQTITLPKLKVVQSNGFRQNTGLTKVDLGACTNIYATGFYNCSALVTLIIRTASVCALANTSAFSGCSKLANIYVPDTLVDSYKAATNWTTYADKIKPLSELGG